MDYKKIYKELNDYLANKDTATFLQRYNELIQDIEPTSEEYVEMLLIKLSYKIMYALDYFDVKSFIDEIASQIKTYGNILQVIKYSINKGVVLGRLRLLDEAIAVHNEVLSLCSDDELKSYKISTLINLGVIYVKKYKYITALRYFLRAYDMNSQSDKPVKHTSILANIAVIYLNIEEYEKGLYYTELCLNTLPESKKSVLPALYNNSILANTKVGNFHKAKEYISLVEQEKNNYSKSMLHSYHKALAEYYYDIANYDKAKEYYQLLIQEVDKKNLSILCSYKISLAKLFLKENKYNECKEIITEIDSLDDYSEILFEKIHYNQLKADYYAAIGDYERAYEYSQLIIKYNNDNYKKLQTEIINEMTDPLASDYEDISSTAYLEKINDLETLNTEIASHESLLISSLNDLRNETMMRDQIISIISHDIRAPIGNIIQLLEMLDEFESPDEKEETIVEIIEAMKSTYSLTNELVTWAKNIIEKKKSTSHNLYIRDIIDNCELLLKHQIAKKHLTLFNHIPSDSQIFGHKNTIETCFRNIISNSLKYSYEFSKIEISQQDKEDEIAFFIRDYGSGMTQEQVDNLFSPGKLSRRGTNSEDGMGIGLLLVKELVNKSNGTIECKSKVGEGTVFTLTFPKH